MRKEPGHVFKKKIQRPLLFNHSGQFKEESTSCIFKSFSPASCRKRLAGEAPAQEVEVGEFFGINGSCVGIVDFLLSGRVDGAIAGVCVFVDLAMPNTLKSACRVQACPETADAREHIKISDYTFSFLHLLPAAHAKSRERHRQRSRLAAAAKLLVGRSCFAAPFGELFLSPAGIASAAPAGIAPDRASSCAARQGSRTEAPTPAGAADCPETALYQTVRFLVYPAWSATCPASRSYACAFNLSSSRITGRRTLPCGR